MEQWIGVDCKLLVEWLMLEATFTLLTTPNTLQRRARELIDTISP